MGKWLARLAALDDGKIVGTPSAPPCQNGQNPVLSVLSVGGEGCAAEIQTVSDLGGTQAERSERMRARLLRWGWSAPEAEAMAERLIRRNAEGDDRVNCAAECAHYRPGRCSEHKRAGLHSPELGRELAGLLQRCPGSRSEKVT